MTGRGMIVLIRFFVECKLLCRCVMHDFARLYSYIRVLHTCVQCTRRWELCDQQFINSIYMCSCKPVLLCSFHWTMIKNRAQIKSSDSLQLRLASHAFGRARLHLCACICICMCADDVEENRRNDWTFRWSIYFLRIAHTKRALHPGEHWTIQWKEYITRWKSVLFTWKQHYSTAAMHYENVLSYGPRIIHAPTRFYYINIQFWAVDRFEISKRAHAHEATLTKRKTQLIRTHGNLYSICNFQHGYGCDDRKTSTKM